MLTVLPMIRSPRWWIRVWDYPRLQLAGALLILLIVQGVLAYSDHSGPTLTDGAFAVATVLACSRHVFRIWPYTPLHRVQSLPANKEDHENTVSVLVANVLQPNRNADGLLAIVRRHEPDIVITVETSTWWDEQLVPQLESEYPHLVRIPFENTYGMHVFSRLELRDICVRNLVTPDIPSVRATVVLRSGREIELHAVHPEPPLPEKDVEERDAELLIVARESAQRRRPTIVAGDLNDVAWSHTTRLFQRVSGLLDPRVGRGIYPTFHAGHWLMRWPLDHLFHDASFRLRELQVLPAYGSDHFPIFASFVHDPSAARVAPKPRADASDQQEATEKIAEGVSEER